MNPLLTWLTKLKKDCPVCAGTGKVACNCNEKQETTCPNCQGKGMIARQQHTTQTVELTCDAPLCHEGKKLCGHCNGTGLMPSGDKCQVCKGSGYVACPVCKGTGRIRRAQQQFWMEHEVCHICNGRGVVDCYQCHGTKERSCPNCKGKGTVPDLIKLGLIGITALFMMLMPVVFIAVLAVAVVICSVLVLVKNKALLADVADKVKTKLSKNKAQQEEQPEPEQRA